MLRAVSAVVLGFALWSVLWLGGNAALFPAPPAEGPVGGVRVLAGLLALSVVCSVVSGALSGRVGRSARPAVALAVFLVIAGVAVQASLWSRMPVWYHAVFLLLLAPATLAGALAGVRR